MNYEFSAEEIKDAARIARIYCQDFSEEKFESLMELARRVDESGYLETVRGVHRLEAEHNVHVTKILDACEELLERNKQLERQVADSELKLNSLGELIKQEQQKYSQIQEATRKAEEALAETIAQREKEAKELRTFQNRAEAEKRRIDKEVEDSHQKANVTREEVIAAGQIKAAAENHGISLEMVMDVSQELTGQGNAKEQLILAIKKHSSLTGYLRELSQWAEQHKAEVTSNISDLQAQQGQAQARVNALEETRRGIEEIIAGLQANVAEEEELRRFYWRYQGRAGLLELLAGWERVVFYRCNSPMSAATRVFDDTKVAHFWTSKPAVCCPHCGSSVLVFDDKPYQTLGLPAGADFKLLLG